MATPSPASAGTVPQTKLCVEGVASRENGKGLGPITAEQVQQRKGTSEEEDTQDQDYYIDGDVVDYRQDETCDAAVLGRLRREITYEEGVEIEWREEP